MLPSPASAGEVNHALAYEPIRFGASEISETAAYLCRSPASTSGVTVAGGVGGL